MTDDDRSWVLTPGHAVGVVWHGPVHPDGSTLQLDCGRAGIVGPVGAVAGLPDRPFIWCTQRLSVAALLALRLQGLTGVLLTDPRGVGRHALALALGLGVPVVVGKHVNAGDVIAVGGPRGVVTPWALVAPADARRVVALGAARGQATVELVGGQAEELALARAAIDRGDVGEVGLLRLEHLALVDPGMASPDLLDLLTAILTALRDVPIAIRLSQWAPDKPRPDAFRLSSAEQLVAVERAAAACQHSAVTIACCAGDPRPSSLAWAPFVESPDERADPARPVWIGLGDLSISSASLGALESRVHALAAAAGGPAYLCGVAADWVALGRSPAGDAQR